MDSVYGNDPWFLTPEDIVRNSDLAVGGKAYSLAKLIHDGIVVPDFVVLRRPPADETECAHILKWWDEIGNNSLAVRSSAKMEDSGQHSFAGQLQSFLNVDDKESLWKAIQDCFASKKRQASLAYQKHFGRFSDGMHVILQRMVQPAFSGVYFSMDPRNPSSGWLLELIHGFGEDLVSGKMTPIQIKPTSPLTQLPEGFSSDQLDELITAAEKVKSICKFEIDMEWCLDHKQKIWVLQSRPITTLHSAQSYGSQDAFEIRLA